MENSSNGKFDVNTESELFYVNQYMEKYLILSLTEKQNSKTCESGHACKIYIFSHQINFTLYSCKK